MVIVENFSLEALVHTELREGVLAGQRLRGGQRDSLAGQTADTDTEHTAAGLKISTNLQGTCLVITHTHTVNTASIYLNNLGLE